MCLSFRWPSLSSVGWFERELKIILDSVCTWNTCSSKELHKPFHALWGYLNLCTGTSTINSPHFISAKVYLWSVVPPPPPCCPLTVALRAICPARRTASKQVPASKPPGKDFRMFLRWSCPCLDGCEPPEWPWLFPVGGYGAAFMGEGELVPITLVLWEALSTGNWFLLPKAD